MTRILRRPVVVAGAFIGAVLIPFVVTAVNLLHPRPLVVLDLAQTELRVRAVFSLHPPLIGLPGRLGHFGVHTGSHPGPLSFFLLAPFYKLYGSDPWALFAGALSLNFLWICVALWLGWRRGRLVGLIGVGAVVLLLVHTFGITVLEQPWNPYLPLMAWTVVLLSAWSVLSDDIVALPVLAVSASYCMQTHIPYLGMGGGLVVVTVIAAVLWRYWRRRVERAGDAETHRLGWLMGDVDARPTVRRLWRWIAGSTLLGLVLWIPPIFDQFHSNEGNLSLIWQDMTNPPQPAGGFIQGVHLVLAHLDIVQLLTGHQIKFVVMNSNWPGAIMLVVWIAAVVVAWRLRVRALVILDAVLAVSLVLATLALSKIYGDLYWYLMMWMWTVAAAMAASIVWSVVAIIEHARVPEPTLRRARVAALGVLSIGLVALFAATTTEAARATIPDQTLSNQMTHVIRPAIAAIEAGKVPGDTGHGKYLVTWYDPVNIGSAGYTLLDELDAHGISVALEPTFLGIVPGRQTVPRGQARGLIHLSVGDLDIGRWRSDPNATEVAYYDGRTAAQKAEFARLRRDARRLVSRAGGDPDVVDKSLVGASLNTSLPLRATQDMSRMSEIGLPVAIFLAPPPQ